MKKQLQFSTLALLFPILLNAQWTTITMPNQHIQFTTAVLGEKVFFGPGSSNSGFFHTHVDVYNAQSGQWEETLEVSIPRCNAAGIGANGKVFFAGGLAQSWISPLMLDIVDIYNSSSGEWEIATLSEARSELKVVRAGDKLLFAGGITSILLSSPSSISTSATVDIYNLTTEQWSTASLSQARVGIAAAAWGNMAIFAGGQTASGEVTDAVDIYDAATDSWSTLTLSEAKGWGAAEAFDGKVYVAGGVTANLTATGLVEILDLATMTWDSAQLSEPRGGMRSGVLGGKIYFAGGGKYNLENYYWSAPFSTTVDIYNASTGEWTTDQLQQPRVNHAAAVTGNKFFVAGGVSSGSSIVEIFTDTSVVIAVEETALRTKISSNPNPVSNHFVLDIQCEKPEDFQVEIIDFNGRLIKRFEASSGTSLLVNAEDWNTGIYWVKVVHEKSIRALRVTKI